jgi:hypothetical protein
MPDILRRMPSCRYLATFFYQYKTNSRFDRLAMSAPKGSLGPSSVRLAIDRMSPHANVKR